MTSRNKNVVSFFIFRFSMKIQDQRGNKLVRDGIIKDFEIGKVRWKLWKWFPKQFKGVTK